MKRRQKRDCRMRIDEGKTKKVLRGLKNNEKEMEQGVTLPYVIRSTVCSNKTKKEENEQEDF